MAPRLRGRRRTKRPRAAWRAGGQDPVRSGDRADFAVLCSTLAGGAEPPLPRGAARGEGLAAGPAVARAAATPPATGGDLNNFTSLQGEKRDIGEPVGGLDQMLLPVKN